MIISGANNLYNNKKTVDELNVFPVPDGDTGTNMSLTVSAIASELLNKGEMTLTKTADAMSFSTLRGARGNSGVILSQFFRGISKSFKGKEDCTGLQFALALKQGSDAAYKAVMKPTEGTILTVAREAAVGAQLAADTDGEKDITAVLEKAVERGNKALRQTTQMLPALKQAGVVDAGGQGWMFVLEGALSYLKTGEIIEKEGGEAEAASPVKTASQAAVSTENIKFCYCTEFIVEKKSRGLSVEEFRNAIAPKGDCMLVIDDDEIVKVHIHTNHPGFVLEEAVKLGEMINLKIDNMKRQHRSILEGSEDVKTKKTEPEKVLEKAEKQKKAAPKTKKDTAPLKDYGFVAVCAGKGLGAILKDLGVDKIIEGGQTMNPSTDDILKAVKRVKSKTVFVFPNNKNIIMAAQQAAQIEEEKKVVVIETTSFPQCVSAMMSFNEKQTQDVNAKNMSNAAKNVATGQLTYAVRDTEIDGMKIKKDDILGMIEGKITDVGSDADDVLCNVISEMVNEDTEYITVYCGKDIKKPQSDCMLRALEAKYEEDEIEVSFKKGGQPLYYYIISVE